MRTRRSFRAMADARPLRVVATGGRIPRDVYDTSAQPTRLEMMTRFPIVIGDDDCTELRLAFDNARMDIGGTWISGAQALTIVGAAIERIDVAQAAPFLFNGQTSTVLAAGAYRQLTDALKPSSVGLSVWPKNTQFWLRVCARYSVTDNFPVGVDLAITGTNGWVYDQANRVDQVVATGVLTRPTAANGAGANGYGPSAVLGRPTNSGKLAVFGHGASFIMGQHDDGTDSSVIGGIGITGRAATVAGTLTSVIPWMAASRGSLGTADFASMTQPFDYAIYCNVAYLNPGNSNSIASTGASAAQIMTYNQTIWAALRAKGIQKIVHTLVSPRTNLSNVPVSSDFMIGGKAEQLNNLVLAQVGQAGGIDAVHRFDELRLSTDPTSPNYWLWGDINWTDDGVHPRDENSYPMVATVARTTMQALTVV